MKRVALVLLVAALALAEQQRCVTVCEKTQDRGMVCEVKCADLIHYDLFPSSCEEDCTYACMMTDLYNDQCYWGCGCPKDAKIGSAIACIDKHPESQECYTDNGLTPEVPDPDEGIVAATEESIAPQD